MTEPHVPVANQMNMDIKTSSIASNSEQQAVKTFVPRPAQARILEYSEGPMGISAVPGSGKTFTLSLLAAKLVERLASEGQMDDREVLVVTFTNSAVANFRSRIGNFLRQGRGLLPGVGYRVRTLHGLAHDIVRERPGLIGLSEDFDIIDERTAADIKRESVLAYLRQNPDALSNFIEPDYLRNFRNIEKYVIEDAIDIANTVIREAKELRVEPFQLQARLRTIRGTWPLLEFGLHVYADYQRSLFTRGAVDFDDLIVLALRALEADENFLTRLQIRWPYVLEDEAQDSSLLQEMMLRKLTAARGNWVRVGDPNQAINTTFTSADTRFLQAFMAEHAEQARDLPNSGRSALPIIDLANYLIRWSPNLNSAFQREPGLALVEPQIEPTPLGDPQPNPPAGNPPIYVFEKALAPDEEVKTVVTSLQRWVVQNPDKTVAVLAPENMHGFRVTEALDAAGILFDDSLLRSDSATRAGAQALATVINYISQPQVATFLQAVWEEVWWPRKGAAFTPQAEGTEAAEGDPFKIRNSRVPSRKLVLPEPIKTFGKALSKLREPETFLFPAGNDWLDSVNWLDSVDGMRPQVEAFRNDLQRWTRAVILPIDELLLTLGNDLFNEPADLALTHHLAVLLAKLQDENPNWRLPELAGELDNIAQNKRRILNFSDDGGGYEPKPGIVTVATMHAAKGLEWDRVYLLAVNNFGFPSGNDGDKYRSERWYVRENLNLVAEAQAQVRQLQMGNLDDYQPGRASQEARVSLAAERLRLLYVGITRARRELIITYNTGRQAERDPNRPALAFEALLRYSTQTTKG
ncbi:MAG: DEAD/DEAH box helicase [Caldilineaceae bacterium]